MKKVGKLVSTTMWSFMSSMTIGGKEVFFRSPMAEEYRGDTSDFPMFTESHPDILRSMKAALLDMTGIFLWNILLALGLFLAVLRADVR